MAKNTFSGKNSKNAYDDGNIPEIDLPQKSSNGLEVPNVEPLPESERPRKDGPGGIIRVTWYKNRNIKKGCCKM